MIRQTYLLCVVYSASLVAGLIQLLLAWRGHLLWDSTWARPADHVQVAWFGYLTTYHWWVPYVTCVPLMVACSVHGLTTMWLLCRHSRLRRWVMVFALVSGVALSCLFVGQEVASSLTIEPKEWAQWNHLRTQPSIPDWSREYRLVLELLGYGHYFVAYALSVACITGALLVAAMLHVPRSMADRSFVKRGLSEVLLSARFVVGGYLFYLVLLRSSKVSMWLKFRNESTSLDKIYEFLTNARPYFEACYEGVLVNIILGLLWCFICIVIHVLSSPIVDLSNQPDLGTLEGVLRRVKTSYNLMGRFWFGLFGLCLLGIVLPPPSGWHFVAVLGIVIGGYLVRRSFRDVQ